VQTPLATGADFITTIYGYDIANRLISMLLQGPTAQIENLAYTYDPNGNRLSFGRSVAQTISPAVGSTNHDTANEMLALGGKNLTYDQNGNLQTKTDVCGTTSYTWDARNRLTGISGFKPDCTALAASFGYDALNRRISKSINGATTQFVYDGWDITQEIKAGVKTNYVRTLNIDEPLTKITGSTIRHYVKDALGSVMALVDDTGTTKTTYVYDAFGNATATGETSDNSFQYTARENDGTGLYHYRFRYYSQEMQRFISEDPIRLLGGINYYSAVQNNPVNRIDPLGLIDVGMAITGGLSTLEGIQTIGIGVGAIAGTAIVTKSPTLTTIIGLEMMPVFWAGWEKTKHGIETLQDALRPDQTRLQKCH
jgi:RHS repeat-associated protein